LRRTKGDKKLAAQLLGIAARTIYRKLDLYSAGRVGESGEASGDAGGSPEGGT